MTLRQAVGVVALLNLGYFGIEFAVALVIGSVSLFADSIDFLEDASINILIFTALGWSALMRARVGMLLLGFCSYQAWPHFWPHGVSTPIDRPTSDESSSFLYMQRWIAAG